MEEVLKRFAEISTDPYTSLIEWKEKTGKKIVGCFPMRIPEEIIHAAGMLPVVMWRGNEAVTLGHSYVHNFNCGLTRSFIDDVMRGKMDFMDGMIFYRSCLQAEEVPSTIELNAPPHHFLYLYLPPLYPGKAFGDFVIHELKRLKENVEQWSGQEITTDSLNNSIEIYNKNRSLLKKIYELRKKKPGTIKAREMLTIVHSGMLMDKEEHNRLLERLLPELEGKKETPNGKIRVVLAGSLCQTPHTVILDLIEEAGMVVVDDDIYVGSRYFANEVIPGGDPMEALADRYMKRLPPDPTMGDWKTLWTDYMVDKVKENNAQGIISLLIKYCPPHLCYYPDIRRRFDKEDIPEIMIEVEHEVVSIEQTRTRLQAFMEVIKGGA
ncbi:MAG: 2-hydroxyacyl-CoA dehydratase family protein [Thermodesulfobacteriota bacterium]|nr:2-hydroxyacyl-CoA dehydratase family protein [Thermodesulfobacteriota bacterium]